MIGLRVDRRRRIWTATFVEVQIDRASRNVGSGDKIPGVDGFKRGWCRHLSNLSGPAQEVLDLNRRDTVRILWVCQAHLQSSLGWLGLCWLPWSCGHQLPRLVQVVLTEAPHQHGYPIKSPQPLRHIHMAASPISKALCCGTLSELNTRCHIQKRDPTAWYDCGCAFS